MLQAARKIREYARGLSELQFKTSSLHQDAILREVPDLVELLTRIVPPEE